MRHPCPPSPDRRGVASVWRVLLASCLLLASAALAQEARRVVVVPFEADDSLQNLALGLATGLQRSLNSVDGVYAPPVGDVAVVAQRAAATDLDPGEVIGDLFAADTLVGGTLRSSGAGYTLTLSLAVGSTGQVENREVTGALDDAPSAVLRAALEPVLDALGVDSENRRVALSVASQAPSLPSLGPVALATSRVPGATLQALETAAGLDADSSWALSEYARMLALSGRTDEAVAASGRAVEALPEDAEAWAVRGVVLNAAGDGETARAAFEEALRLNPTHALALGGLAVLESDRDTAVADLQRAIAIYPRLLDAQLRLAALQGTPQRALQVLLQAGDSLPESEGLHLDAIRRVVAAGDDAGATAYLRGVLARPIARTPALYALAAELPAGQRSAAEAILAEGEALFPDNPALTLARGRLLVDQEAFAEAEALLAPLFEANPQNLEIANVLAIAQARQGETEAAAATFGAFADRNPTLRLNLAQLFLASGQARAALDALEPLVAANPDDPDVNAYYGIALGRSGRVDEGMAALDHALEVAPDFEFASRARALLEQQRSLAGDSAVRLEGAAAQAFDRGLFALEQQDFAEAADAFSEAREGDAAGLAAFYQGYALQLSGRVRDALAAYQTAVEAMPENDVVLNNLGYAYLQVGRFDRALDALDRSLAVNPDNARAHLNLGLTYYGVGRYPEAIDAWDRAIELDPSLAASVTDLREEAQSRATP